MATNPSILVRKTPWTEELSGLWSMASPRDRHDVVIKQQQQKLVMLNIFSCAF